MRREVRGLLLWLTACLAVGGLLSTSVAYFFNPTLANASVMGLLIACYLIGVAGAEAFRDGPARS